MKQALVLVLLAGCPSEKKTAPPPDAAPVATAPARVDAGPPPVRTCRAIAADLVTIDAGAEVPPGAWLDIDKGGKLTTKDPRTGREIGFEGPARVIPCKEGAEEAWLTRGTATSTPGSGEAPGQEEWIVTPLGVLRYSAASARVTVTDKADAVHVTLGSGSAYAWLADGATKVTDGPARAEDGWISLGSGAGLVISAGKSGDARAATTRCTRAATAAAEGARALLAPDGSLGALGARHVVLRREARAACAVAALRVAAVTDDAERKALQGLVDEADRAWHSSHLGEAKAR